MKNAKLNWIRLPLIGVENCRELGGYSSEFGQQTNWHSFLRSSDMSKLTQEDIHFLKDYGVKTVIDLRGEDEIQKSKNVLADENFCKYINIPFVTELVSNMDFTKKDFFMGDFYVEMLKNNLALKSIFNNIAQAEEGCILFHCAAGKDRTGVLAMLLLGLAGVEKRDIITNYEVTYTNLESMHSLEGQYKDVPEDLLNSKSENIKFAYEYIIHNYRSVNEYLLNKGIEQKVIDQVKKRLLLGAEVTVA